MRSLFRQSGFTLTPVSLAWALCLVVCMSGGVLAQRKSPAPKPATPTRQQPIPTTNREPELRLEPLTEDPSVEAADVAITAHVKGRELKFDVVPNPSVEFPGQPARETIWEAERENLPTPVQPGVTYRDIGIRLKITSVFSDIDRIVAEALGEVPITDDAKAVASKATKKPPVTPNAAPPSPQAATSRSLRKQQ